MAIAKWSGWAEPRELTNKRTGKTWTHLPSRCSPKAIPGFLRKGRRFLVEMSNQMYLGGNGRFGLGPDQYRVIEFDPLYKRRKRGHGKEPRERLCWNYRSSGVFKTEKAALAWLERQL